MKLSAATLLLLLHRFPKGRISASHPAELTVCAHCNVITGMTCAPHTGGGVQVVSGSGGNDPKKPSGDRHHVCQAFNMLRQNVWGSFRQVFLPVVTSHRL